jgi:hypothetical protein
VAVVEEKGVGSEVRRWEVKEVLIPKTKGRQLEAFLYSATNSLSAIPPSFPDNQHTCGGCGEYVDTGGCVVGGRPGICGPASVGNAYAIPGGGFGR